MAPQDLSPQDPSTLLDGGDLRLPLSTLPPTFNHLHLDGSSGETRQVIWALMPRVFESGADGRPVLDSDYVVSAAPDPDDPAVIEYRIRDEARWSSGRPIDWTDFAAQADALRGPAPGFEAVAARGEETVLSVERGADDKEVRVTLDRPLAEWHGLFSPLYPRETTSDPLVFNEGWRSTPLDTAGPFRVESVDRVGQSVVLSRDPSWWGPSPRLDRILFVAGGGQAERLANGELDAIEITDAPDLALAQQADGVDLRVAPDRRFRQLVFNGGPGAPLADLRLRRAVAQGIDREQLARVDFSRPGETAPLTGNHFLPVGHPDYRDNSDVLPHDPAAARRALDASGWRLAGGPFRERDGRRLELRLVTQDPLDAGARLIAAQLADIGVEVRIDTAAPADFFPDHVATGAFDLVVYRQEIAVTPLLLGRLAHLDPAAPGSENNVGRVGTPEITAALTGALVIADEAARGREINRIDRLVWAQAHSLPLQPDPGLHAVREDLANWGGRGLADWDYLAVGYLRPEPR